MQTMKQAQALTLHRDGKNMREIGDALNVTRARARELVTRSRLVERQTAWADGLPTRYARLLMGLGIRTVSDVQQSIDCGKLHTLPGIGPKVYSAICTWAQQK